MSGRLQWFKTLPQSWLHWEPRLGGLESHADVQKALGAAQCLIEDAGDPRAAQRHLSPQEGVWRRLLGPRGPKVAEPGQTVDMVWANMALHAWPDPRELMSRWYQYLHDGGFVMFSCFGPDTLGELRSIYAKAGWGQPAHMFTDMHDWGDMLVHEGFAEPVMDMEHIELSWSSPQAMLAELRELGRNLSNARFRGLRGRQWRASLESSLAQNLSSGEDHRLKLRFEVVYGHAYRTSKPVRGDASISLADMRRMLGQKSA
ncbi:hypothetical protein NBRC116584_13690 [Hydrogenophaga sp. 5NK40-0174]